MAQERNNQVEADMIEGSSLREVLSGVCRQYADLAAFSCEGSQLTYRTLDNLSDRFAAWLLRESTLEPGDRVAVQLPNLLQYPVVVLGVIKAGMVIVNINPLYTAGETEHQLRDSGARALVVLEELLPVTGRILPGTSIEKVIVTRPADLHPWYLRIVHRLSSLKRKNHPGNMHFSGRVEFGTVLKKGRKILKGRSLDDLFPGSLKSGGEPEPVMLQYTGGTTGTAKGAKLSHDNLIANMLQVDHALEGHVPPPGSTVLSPLPFYHIYAFTISLLFSLYRGYHGLLIPDPRKTDKLVKTIRRYRINGLVGVSTLYHNLCKHPEFDKLDFTGLSICTSGGMPLSLSTARRWEKLTGCRILEGYGLTETAPLVASGKYDEYQAGKIGRATRWTELKIIGPDGNTLPPGQEGEILVRGPQVMMGYWERPEETRAVMDSGGWLHTGDIGVLDEEGYLSVVDRIKDLILVSGFNVYPAEIEDHVNSHPDIRDAAVIGVPNEKGESVKLFVISDNPNLSEGEIIKFCRQGLTPYKVPNRVEFRASLPRSSIGKILRRQLREDQRV